MENHPTLSDLLAEISLLAICQLRNRCFLPVHRAVQPCLQRYKKNCFPTAIYTMIHKYRSLIVSVVHPRRSHSCSAWLRTSSIYTTACQPPQRLKHHCGCNSSAQVPLPPYPCTHQGWQHKHRSSQSRCSHLQTLSSDATTIPRIVYSAYSPIHV